MRRSAPADRRGGGGVLVASGCSNSGRWVSGACRHAVAAAADRLAMSKVVVGERASLACRGAARIP